MPQSKQEKAIAIQKKIRASKNELKSLNENKAFIQNLKTTNKDRFDNLINIQTNKLKNAENKLEKLRMKP